MISLSDAEIRSAESACYAGYARRQKGRRGEDLFQT